MSYAIFHPFILAAAEETHVRSIVNSFLCLMHVLTVPLFIRTKSFCAAQSSTALPFTVVLLSSQDCNLALKSPAMILGLDGLFLTLLKLFLVFLERHLWRHVYTYDRVFAQINNHDPSSLLSSGCSARIFFLRGECIYPRALGDRGTGYVGFPASCDYPLNPSVFLLSRLVCRGTAGLNLYFTAIPPAGDPQWRVPSLVWKGSI